MNLSTRYRGALLGLAAGDAVGTTLEFRPRGTFEPLTDMTGGGPFDLEPGQWTDDTSMALCLAESLLECDGFDAADQMRRYVAWRDEGHLSSTGRCFDIGTTVQRALHRFQQTGDAFAGSTAPDTAGNGSLMRLAPAIMFGYPDVANTLRLAAESSRTTHGAAEAVAACELMAVLMARAFDGSERSQILTTVDSPMPSQALRSIADMAFLGKPYDDIRGSGYVVQSLEAALWCFAHGSGFRESVLLASNLGDDADTTAAICGQIAGAHYGIDGIPPTWVRKLAMRELIEDWADRLALRAGPD